MAYLPMTQEVIKFMNKNFDKDDIISYQMLITLFGNLFANEKEFLKDPGDRMGLSHFVENFLRKNNFQTLVTINDLNEIFNSNKNYDINNIELYKIFFTLIYEELSANDPQISFRLKEAIFYLIDLIEKSVEEIEQNIILPQPEEQDNVSIINQPSLNDTNENQVFNFVENSSKSFIIHNKKYLYEYIRNKNLLPYECSVCGLVEWQNEPLRLELDSIDGVYSNLNISNLRFLCPNCYSQIGHQE